MTQPVFARYQVQSEPAYVYYEMSFVGIRYQLRITGDATLIGGVHGGQVISTPADAKWRLVSLDEADNETELASYPIDHVTTTCLAPPLFEVSGVTVGGCTGSFAFGLAQMVTVPFHNRFFNQPIIQEDISYIPPPGTLGTPCQCDKVTRVLSISGVRHAGGDWECVEFVWNEGLNDRWQYLPPGGDPTTDREVIYLRADSYGNCYLELDFEQSGIWTNDWATPQNSFDASEPNAIRDGMLPIEECGCCIKPLRSYASGGRYVDMHAGPCSQWDYVCAKCRCVPRKLCLFGSLYGIDDTFFGSAEWDGEGWNAGQFRLFLRKDIEGNCVLAADGVDLNDSQPVRCGPFLGGEMVSDYNSYYTNGVNWLWISGTLCGDCVGTYCGPCSTLCVSSPLTVFVELTVEIRDGTAEDNILETCVYNITVHYFQRWDLTNPSSPLIVCGYFGYSAAVTCGSDVFHYAVSTTGQQGEQILIIREFISGPLFDAHGIHGGLDYIVVPENYFWITDECDPFFREGDFFSGSAQVIDCGCRTLPASPPHYPRLKVRMYE